jgi:AcrR family transcriptional regulator
MTFIDHRTQVASERRERMRIRLMAAALQLAASEGLLSVTIDKVIAQAQVARGTFYKYFDSPSTLIQALGETVSDELIRSMHPFIVQVDDQAQRVAIGIRTVLQCVTQYPALGLFMVRTGWPYLANDHAFLTLVSKNLQAGIKLGRFSPMPTQVASSVLAGTLLGAMHAIAQQKKPNHFAQEAAAAVLRALGLSSEEASAIASQADVLPIFNSDGLLLALVTGEA